MRLLLAEDDPKLLKSLKHIFETNKFSVDVVNNGEDALHYALSDEYDGLVLDIMMPGLDGIEVLKRLRKENVTTPALFLTARPKCHSGRRFRCRGCDYLQSLFPHRNCLPVSALCCAGKTTMFQIFWLTRKSSSIDPPMNCVMMEVCKRSVEKNFR